MICQAVIPAAGFGTRFLPFTKAVPKELVPLGNKPSIDYIMQEILSAGLKKSIIITAPGKEAIKHYFSPDKKLETFLAQKNKSHLLDDLNKLTNAIQFEYIYQEHALGLGHAIKLARPAITHDFFAILLPDDIIIGDQPEIGSLIQYAQLYNTCVLAVQEVPKEAISSYGIIAIDKELENSCYQVKSVIEKPKPEDAPSNLAIIGRYILPTTIFSILDTIQPGAGGEIQLTDGIDQLINQNFPVIAVKIKGTRFDVGTPTGWLAANNALIK